MLLLTVWSGGGSGEIRADSPSLVQPRGLHPSAGSPIKVVDVSHLNQLIAYLAARLLGQARLEYSQDCVGRFSSCDDGACQHLTFLVCWIKGNVVVYASDTSWSFIMLQCQGDWKVRVERET